MKKLLIILLGIIANSIFVGLIGMEKQNDSPQIPQNVENANKMLLDAAKRIDIKLVQQALLAGADVNMLGDGKYTPLHEAIACDFLAMQSERLNVVRLLIEHGANVDAQSKSLSTPLHVAVVRRNVDIVKLLIEKGANIDAQSDDGDTPLHDAVWQGCFDLAEVLISNGANVNLRNMFGRTPLHHSQSLLDIVVLLAEHGANINAGDENLITPLYVAAINRHINVVEWLIGHGGKSIRKIRSNVLCLGENYGLSEYLIKEMLAQRPNREKFILADRRVAEDDLNRALPLAVALGQDELLDTMLSSQFNAYLKPEALGRALTAAAATGQLLLFMSLYESIRKNSGDARFVAALEDALFWAALNRHEDVVNSILEHAFALGQAGNLNVQRVGQHVASILRRQTDIPEPEREVLTRILQRLGTARCITTTCRQATALDVLAQLIPQLPSELLVLLMGFCLTPYLKKQI